MAIKELVSQEDLVFYEIMKNPVLFGEFVYNMDRLDREEKFAFTVYQKEFLLYNILCFIILNVFV